MGYPMARNLLQAGHEVALWSFTSAKAEELAAKFPGLATACATPKDVAAKLTAAIVESLADPHVRERFAALGQEIPPPAQQTPQSLRAHHAAEIKLWWPLIKAAGIKIE